MTFSIIKISVKTILLAIVVAHGAYAQTASRPYFDFEKDLLLAQYDLKPDEDDVHSAAAFASMLSHKDTERLNYYVVAGTYGRQNGTFINTCVPDFFNLLFGEKNITWTDAHNEREQSKLHVIKEIKKTKDRGGKIFIAEGGQSDFTYDLIQMLLKEGMDKSFIKTKIIVVQHSYRNEKSDMSTIEKLNWVRGNINYIHIDDGNRDDNKTPGYSSWSKDYMEGAMSNDNPNKRAKYIWTEAYNICKNFNSSWENKKIVEGGVDFSDHSEIWWILNQKDIAWAVDDFWQRYVVNQPYSINKIPQFSTAGFYEVENSPRKVYNFNIGWRFFKGDIENANTINFDDSNWEAANLPHGLEILGENASGGKNYQGVAWYRKVFKLYSKNKSQRTYIYFEAIMGKCEVWVNGKKVTEHFGGYLPFAVDITDVAKQNGETNVIAVKADNSDDKTYLPGKRQGGLDFTYLGGIYRDTYIIQTAPTHVTIAELSNTVAGGGVFVGTLDINNNTATLEVRTEITNQSPGAKRIQVRTTLEDTDYHTLHSFEQSTVLRSKKTKQLKKQFNVSNVKFWHPDSPNLHFIKTEIIEDGKVIDAMRTRIGIRLFEMKGKEGLFINKKPYNGKIVGVNRHQDYNYVGNALPNSGQWRDVKILREGGAKIIRAGHYPQDPAFYDACDALGMFATTANPGWHFFNFKDPIFEKRLYNDTRELVRRDRNVASLLMWETALNETREQPAYAMSTMHKIAHDENPFPGMFTVTDAEEAKKAGMDLHYHGTDPNVNSFTREYGDGGEVDNWTSQNATTRVKMEWGEKPLLTQALMQAETLNGLFTTPKSRLGGAKWAGIDHQRGYHPDPFWGGLLNGFRIPRYLYYVYKSQYDHDYNVSGVETGPMLFIAHELTQISSKDIVVFSNCDEVRLTWLGKQVTLKSSSAETKFKDLPHPPYIFKDIFDFSVIKSKYRSKTKEVKLIAEGLIDGKVVVRQEKDYPEHTAGVRLSIAGEGIGLTADGADFIPVRATIVDIDGNKKVLASENVHFTIEGPAEIIGNNTTHANPAKTEMGVATALIRALTSPGKITVTAHVNGLESDSITFESQPVTSDYLYDEKYFNTSVKPKTSQTLIIQKKGSELPNDVLELKKKIKQLELIITGKEQDLMEIRSKIKK